MSEREVDDMLMRVAKELQTKCSHARVQPSFDHEAAKTLSVSEIRKRWPRFMGTCPDCNGRLILYASAEHYAMGDW